MTRAPGAGPAYINDEPEPVHNPGWAQARRGWGKKQDEPIPRVGEAYEEMQAGAQPSSVRGGSSAYNHHPPEPPREQQRPGVFEQTQRRGDSYRGGPREDRGYAPREEHVPYVSPREDRGAPFERDTTRRGGPSNSYRPTEDRGAPFVDRGAPFNTRPEDRSRGHGRGGNGGGAPYDDRGAAFNGNGNGNANPRPEERFGSMLMRPTQTEAESAPRLVDRIEMPSLQDRIESAPALPPAPAAREYGDGAYAGESGRGGGGYEGRGRGRNRTRGRGGRGRGRGPGYGGGGGEYGGGGQWDDNRRN